MSETVGPSLLVKYLSALFVIWLTLWVIILPFIPRELYTASFFTCGITPVIGWFLVRPQRIRWFILLLFGLNQPHN